MWDCAAPSIPLFWLFRGYLKEESEGRRDAAALCLFKNTDVKVCVGERMKVMGWEEEGRERGG